MLKISDFFPSDIDHPFLIEPLNDCTYVWDLLLQIKPKLTDFLNNTQVIKGNVSKDAYIGNKPLFIDEGAIIEPGVFIEGPAYIGKDVTVRHGAYVRENSILLERSLLGHTSEIKNSILFPSAHAPHFNYIGDSLLGRGVNLGAGTKLSNLTVVSQKDPITKVRPTIKIKINNKLYDTGLSKLGAILGENAQTGCNSVLNPGCLIGKNTLIYANVSLMKGYYPPDKMIKLRQNIVIDPKFM